MQGKINRVVIEAKNLYENWKKRKLRSKVYLSQMKAI